MVGLTGTAGYSMMLGGNYFLVVTDGSGNTCQLIMHTNPGPVGSRVTVHGYIAYVSPGNPPISRIAPPDYPDIPK